MKSWPYLIALSFVSIFTVVSLRAQQKDFKLWSNAQFETSLSKNFDLVFEISNRWHENLSRRDETFAETGIDFSKKWFSSGISYRFENKNDIEKKIRYGHRIIAYISVKAGINRFKCSLRNKFQAEYLAIKDSEKNFLNNSYDRTRFRIGYDIRNFPANPSLSYEFFNRLKDNQLYSIGKQRLGLGIDYMINRGNKIRADFYYQYGIPAPMFSRDYILSISYSLKLFQGQRNME